MKKLSFLFVIASVFLLAACTSAQGAVQTVVELPTPIQLFILSTITLVVGVIFTKIAEAIPWLGDFLGQYADEVSTTLAGALVLVIQTRLNAIPPEWEGVANAALALVVAILAAIGFLKTVRKVALSYAAYKLTKLVK